MRQSHHEFQSSYVPNDSTRYWRGGYEWVVAEVGGPNEMIKYRFIQGLEVAVNGVGDAQSARSMIDTYLLRQYCMVTPLESRLYAGAD